MTLVSGNVLVTGATGGLGQAIARAFAARGAKLMLTGRKGDVLERLAAELGAQAVPCDLFDRDQVQSLAEQANAAAIDVFVSNAGLPGAAPLTELTLEQVDRVLEVNLRAPVALTHALLPGMIERRRGHIVFMSSLQGRAPTVGASTYVATKFGLRGFSLALREDLRNSHVGVSVILPGFIRDAGLYADAGVRLPAGIRTPSPDDVAAAVLRAVERNRSEIDVAPLSLRVGAKLASLAPQTAAAVSRLMGSERIAAEYAEGLRDKRS
jgi:short-subunit dehydrogenase